MTNNRTQTIPGKRTPPPVPKKTWRKDEETGDWRDYLKAKLVGRGFDEQEELLAPEAPSAPGDTPFEALVQAPETSGVGGKAPRSKVGPRSKKAPPPPVKRTQGAPTQTPPTQAPPVQAPPETEHTRVAARLEQGARATGMIKAGIENAGVEHGKLRVEHDAQVKQVEAENAKRGFFAKLTGKGKKPLPPPLPAYDHAGAAQQLERTGALLTRDAATARRSQRPVPPTLVRAAGDMVDGTAGRIDQKVEAPHVESTRDLATGLRDGDEPMVARLLARGGTLSYATLQAVRSLGTNKEANVYQMNYLGMAPLVYKRSTQGKDDCPDEEDPVLREQQTMHAIAGPERLLKAGGRTIEKRGFVMPFVKRGDLAGVAQVTKDLPLVERMEIWRHLMRGGFEGLDALHGTGRAHGDVKNENFLLGDDMEPKLMDFGTTRPEEKAEFAGTSTYMAPEVPTTQQANQASDVWSMGESLLMGLFDLNSIDFAQDRTTKNTVRFNQEHAKAQALRDGTWLARIEARVAGQPDADDFMAFVKKVMALDPKERFTAKGALQSEFLKKKKDATGATKRALREALRGAGKEG